MENQNGAGTSPPEPNANSAPPGPEIKKRGRGRPPGSTNKTAPLPETPSSDGSAQTQEPQPQKRRRRAAAVDTEKLAKQLKGLHMLLARLLNDPVMNLGDIEAVMLADSLAAVSREYDLALDGKTGAFIQLAGTAAVVYLPRVIHLQAKSRANKRRSASTIDGVATPVGDNASTAGSPAH